MAELHSPEGPIHDAATPAVTPPAAAAAAATAIAPQPTNESNPAPTGNTNNLGSNLGPKRHRRPSVRLGEIGDQPATLSHDSHHRRPKAWRFHKDPVLAAKASKTRPLTNLVNGGADCHETLETEDNLDFGHRKPKPKRPTAKRVRTNWTVAAKVDNGGEGESREENKEFRDFEPEGSESPMKEQSPIQSIDNVALDFWHGHRRTARARVSMSRDDGLPESDSRDRKWAASGDRNFGSDNGVRNWLIGLGLSRYAPVFEIHEVDDEVLPMLTLEDLKDMGINAVGSRRKMYSAIQKLGKGYS
ncbi:uncharacterized protein LOC127809490 [Diospyros lotus]|uniref:uncharacterized protein LOC127809490 n=1 Tax=Diospyros lotus TaxID=55363 RepID=UPI00224CDA37|nr:uncharacterized protein LOC127809490 [Diospyros lotus]XP_052204280.1 uncharacterized protein LOC127809490 [Diospyros lotus]XP_052204281.1 uncharacterized protein LOC127809490 [Diospyros lotus]XP_052204282.1 uncharacterized protein LOC127809490 [Diospyros lotus]XP_052204283.1 uncharacterized protein LOC127809490 [Diospyros lotus]XP_052204284.1 uncharacterized protein LOC127809490 [Diospyros lotus]